MNIVGIKYFFKTSTFTAVLTRYGTMSVPATLTSVATDSGRLDYLVLNIEFNRTYYLLGFEFYAVNAGTVQTAVRVKC